MAKLHFLDEQLGTICVVKVDMKNAILIFLVLGGCLGGQLSAQFGLRLKYISNEADPFISNIDDEHSLELGLDYWFRLKNQRIEFLPEISYERSEGESAISEDNPIRLKSWNFLFNTNIYFLDLNNDCDCPTFSKQGNAFTKGFHLILSPGIRYYSLNDESVSAGRNFGLIASGGLGFDIGVNDLITITPHVLYRFNPSIEANIPVQGNVSTTSHTYHQFNFGFRIGFRPDYKSPRFNR